MPRKFQRTVTFRQVDDKGNIEERTFQYRNLFLALMAIIWVVLTLCGLAGLTFTK